MELLLLLFIPLALGALSSSGGDDSDDDTENNAEEPTEAATDGNDILRGNASDNIANGGDGTDLLFGYRGDDVLTGGAGDDLLSGGLDDDTLNGGNGTDVMAGAAGNDSLLGERGDDLLFGGAGDDTLDGGSGDDVLIGSTGADQLYGGDGDDILEGITPISALTISTAFDAFRIELAEEARQVFPQITDGDVNRFLDDAGSDDGAHAPDALFGGAGEDALSGDNGDTLSGGADEDRFAVFIAEGNDPVLITDYDTVAGEELHFIVEGSSQDLPQLGLRDGAAGAEFVLGQDVVLTLQGISADQVGLGAISLQNTAGFGISNPVVRLG